MKGNFNGDLGHYSAKVGLTVSLWVEDGAKTRRLIKGSYTHPSVTASSVRTHICSQSEVDCGCQTLKNSLHKVGVASSPRVCLSLPHDPNTVVLLSFLLDSWIEGSQPGFPF